MMAGTVISILVSVLISINDHVKRKIPNILLLVLILVKVLLLSKSPISTQGIQTALFLFMAFWYPYQKQWIGAGDIKYMMVTVLFIPDAFLLYGLISIFLLGGLASALGKFILKQNKIPYSYPITVIFIINSVMGVL